MAAEIKQVFPEHAQALIAVMKQKTVAMEALQQAQLQFQEASVALEVLIGLLGLPNEEGMQLRVFIDGRVEITHPTKLATPAKNLLIVNN